MQFVKVRIERMIDNARSSRRLFYAALFDLQLPRALLNARGRAIDWFLDSVERNVVNRDV